MTNEDKTSIAAALTSLLEAEELVRRYEQQVSERRAWLIQQLEDRLGRGKRYGVKEKFALPRNDGRTMVVSVTRGRVEDGVSYEWNWSHEMVN